MAKYLDSAGVTRLVTKLKSDVIPSVKVNAAKAADTVPASGITGVIDIAHIPQGALERVVTVANNTERYKLTTSQVQLGDTVKVISTGCMFIVVDESKLSSSAGYMEYAAGTAASVPWSGVTDKPSTFTPSSHTHTMKLKIGDTTKDGSTASTTSWSKAEIIGTPSVSGSGNAVTGMTVSGDTVTLTKGTTFATKAQNDALDTRISVLEDFTGGTEGSGGGLVDQLNVAGYDVVRFDGFLASKPTLQQTSTISVVGLVIVKSATPSTTPGAIAIDCIIASDGSKYYGNWKDCIIATPDVATKKQLYLHKIYLDTSTGKAYYAVDDTTLKEIDGGDVAMTTGEVDAAVAAAK